MKILVGIPCLYGPEHTKASIASVINEADVLIIDNGADQSVKDVISQFDCLRIVNEKNIYVNPAWNQILEYFLWEKSYDILVLMNSDLIMQEGWSDVLKNTPEDVVAIPNLGDFYLTEDIEVHQGTAGVFIHLNRKQAKIVYPVPECCRVWFGDLFIYSVLRALGYMTIVRHELKAVHFHNGSNNVKRVLGIDKIIEEDKVQWEREGIPLMMDVIKKYL